MRKRTVRYAVGAVVTATALAVPATAGGVTAAAASSALQTQAAALRAVVSARTAVLAAAPSVAAKKAAERAPRVQAAAAANPVIDETCGLDATLTLDSSGSIGNAANQVRTAAQDFLMALKDTNSTLRINSFATRAKQLAARAPVNAATTGPGGSLSDGVAAYPSPNGGTNWMEGLDLTNSGDSSQPELLIFVTDGDPTYWTKSDGSIGGTGQPTATNIANSLGYAVAAADRVQTKDTRILVVGVGNGLTEAGSQQRMKDISGPNLITSPGALAGKTINDVDAVAFTDFAALGAFLRSVVTSLCGNSVTVQKLAQSSADAQYLPATGWDVTVQPTVAGGITWVKPNQGSTAPSQTDTTAGAQGTAAFQWKPNQASASASVKVTETVKNNFNADRWECDVKKPDGTTATVRGDLTDANPSFTFAMAPSDVAACRLYNDFDYDPGLSITKAAADNPIRGNAAGWDETYTFRVTNTGNAVLHNVMPVDSKCQATMSGPSGPGAAAGELQPGDTWTYTCTRFIFHNTSSGTITETNTAHAIGTDPTGALVESTDVTVNVDVKTPAIRVVKSAVDAFGNPILPDSVIAAGTRVTYRYTVTNPGNDTLRDVTIADDKCSPISGPTGDTNNNQRLETTETWVYQCSKKLLPASSESSVHNTVTVSGKWSNPQGRTQNNAPVTDSDDMEIKVNSAANLTVVKQAQPGDDPTPFAFTVAGNRVPPADTSFSLSSGESRSMVVEPLAGSSSYTIVEAGKSGWNRLSIACVDDDTGTSVGTTTIGTGTAVVPLNAEQSVTCTYVNGRLPRLTIQKSAPGGGALEFDYTATGVGTPSFSLAHGESRQFPNVTPGTVTVTESVLPAGWRLDSITCDSGAWSTSGAQVEVDLDYGDDVVCKFNNAKLPPATLTVLKTGTTGVPSPDFDFTVSGTGTLAPGEPTPPNAEFDLAIGESRAMNVWPGEGAATDYTVTEAAPPDPEPGQSRFALTAVQCIVNGDQANPVNGTIDAAVGGDVVVPLQPGDDATCTFTNQLRPRLTILKTVSFGEGQTGATFFFDGTGILGDISLPETAGDRVGRHVYADLDPEAAFSLTEQLPTAEWSLTQLVCDGTGDSRITVSQSERSISSTGLDYGDDVTCYFANTKAPLEGAQLVVTKIADPTAGAPVFDFSASGIGIQTVGEQGSVNFSIDPSSVVNASYSRTVYPVETGNEYTVTEAGQPGWNLMSLECVKAGADPVQGDLNGRDVTISLLPGETGVCTFTNQKPGTLSVAKQTDTATDREFDFAVTGGLSPDSFSLGAGERQVFTGIAGGTQVVVTEDVPGGDDQVPDRWELSDIVCTGTATPPDYDEANAQVTVVVGAGEDVDCTYSDARVQPAVLTVQKAADPADGSQAFSYRVTGDHNGVLPADQRFSLTPDAAVASRTFEVYPPSSGEQYTINEEPLPDRWSLLDVTCVRGQAVVAEGTASSVQFALNPGDTATCTYRNQKDASLTAIKSAPDDPSLQFPFLWSAPDSPFTLRDSESRTAENLAPGAYSVQEDPDLMPIDWYLGGDHPVCTGTQEPPAYDVPLGASLTIGAGEDVFCTFANFYDYRPAIQLDKTPNRTSVLPGGTVVYDYELTNVGNTPIPLAGLDPDEIVVDDQCEPVTRLTGDEELGEGETWTFRCTTTLQQDTRNVATATMRNPLPDEPDLTSTDEATVDVLVPAITVDKRPDKLVVYPGDEVTYTYDVKNTGEVPLKDVTIADDTCSPVTYVSGDGTGGALANGILEVHETWVYTCTTTLTQTTTNMATVGGDGFIPEYPDEVYGVTDDDTKTVDVVIKDITIDKSATAPGGVVKDGVLVFPAGERVTYHYDVTSGNATTPMQVLTITDDKCSPVKYVSGDTNGNGLVDPGETWRYTCSKVVAGAQQITNTAAVVALEPLVGGTSTDDDKAVVESYLSAIALLKSVDRDIVPIGATVKYTYRVTNPGSTPLSDITLTDDKCSPVVYRSGDVNGDKVLQTTEEWIYDCSMAVQDSVQNVAVVTGKNPAGATVDATSSARVQVLSPEQLDAQIRVLKTPSATKVKKGKDVTFTYRVWNPGRVPLAQVKELITDNRCSPVTYVRGDNDGNNLLTSGKGLGEYPKETWFFTCTTKITKKTTNTVDVGGIPTYNGEQMGPEVNDSDQATVSITGSGGGGGGGGGDHDDSGGGDVPPGPDVPSVTGADVARWLLLALAALLAGSVMVLIARRRTAT